MRTLMLLTVIAILGGCATLEDFGQHLWPTDSAGGTYMSSDETGVRLVLLYNGIAEVYANGEKEEVAKWEKIGKEVYIVAIDDGGVGIFSINPDGSLTYIAVIKDGKRENLSKDKQVIWEKTQQQCARKRQALFEKNT